ncbi:Serine/arginine-rich-splicing factor SR34 [Phytophthora nicotianae]|nr:Serine/arginine-rich-splicing factor SR34 [Phytophthora nicotianae]
MLMSPEEGLIKAAGTNQVPWIENLLETYDGDLTDAIVSASANGHVEPLLRLLQETQERGSSGRIALQKVVKTAATHGRLNVISVFLPQIADSDQDTEALLAMYESTWQVLDEATARGYRDVIRFAIEFATEWGYIDSYASTSTSDALARAIEGCLDDVAIYLLGIFAIPWKMKDALEKAIERGQFDIIEWTYVIYVQRAGVGQMLTDLASDGNIGAVKYLCTHFGIPPCAINEAFRSATGISTIQFLYNTGCISPGSITMVFRNASGRGRLTPQVLDEYYQEKLEIVELLCKESCIPPRVVRFAFVGAAARGDEDLLNVLWNDYRLNDQTFVKAFNIVVTDSNLYLTRVLFHGGRISAQSTNNALLVSSSRGYQEIVLFLIDAPGIVDWAKEKVFLDAVRSNRSYLVQCLCDKRSWPARVVKRAVCIADNRELNEIRQTLTRLGK